VLPLNLLFAIIKITKKLNIVATHIKEAGLQAASFVFIQAL
jgi:hypothetical protein